MLPLCYAAPTPPFRLLFMSLTVSDHPGYKITLFMSGPRSFFDTMSSYSAGSPISGAKISRKKQRDLNLETFGISAVAGSVEPPLRGCCYDKSKSFFDRISCSETVSKQYLRSTSANSSNKITFG